MKLNGIKIFMCLLLLLIIPKAISQNEPQNIDLNSLYNLNLEILTIETPTKKSSKIITYDNNSFLFFTERGIYLVDGYGAFLLKFANTPNSEEVNADEKNINQKYLVGAFDESVGENCNIKIFFYNDSNNVYITITYLNYYMKIMAKQF